MKRFIMRAKMNICSFEMRLTILLIRLAYYINVPDWLCKRLFKHYFAMANEYFSYGFVLLMMILDEQN